MYDMKGLQAGTVFHDVAIKCRTYLKWTTAPETASANRDCMTTAPRMNVPNRECSASTVRRAMRFALCSLRERSEQRRASVDVGKLDAHGDESAEQRFQHRRIIIDPAQQDSLRKQRYAGAGQPRG